jgi:hypothetical protein
VRAEYQRAKICGANANSLLQPFGDPGVDLAAVFRCADVTLAIGEQTLDVKGGDVRYTQPGIDRNGYPRGSPKTDHRGSLQNRPMVNITRDVDLDARANILGQHEQCLERRKEAASHSLGTAGMVPAKDPEGHRSPPDYCGRLSASRGRRPPTAGRLGEGCAGKTGQRGDPRLGPQSWRYPRWRQRPRRNPAAAHRRVPASPTERPSSWDSRKVVTPRGSGRTW